MWIHSLSTSLTAQFTYYRLTTRHGALSPSFGKVRTLAVDQVTTTTTTRSLHTAFFCTFVFRSLYALSVTTVIPIPSLLFEIMTSPPTLLRITMHHDISIPTVGLCFFQLLFSLLCLLVLRTVARCLATLPPLDTAILHRRWANSKGGGGQRRRRPLLSRPLFRPP